MARRRGRETVRDMVLSLALVLGVVVIVVAVQEPRGVDPVRVVDYSGSLQAARSAAAYPVLAPEGLSAGWRPTSSRTDVPAEAGGPLSFRIGYVTPGDEFATVVQSDDPADDVLARELPGLSGRTPVQVGGTSWQQGRTMRGELALSRTTGRSTVVVTGSASEDELRALAAALRPPP